MLCRYDTMALKSLDIFSIHGFPVGLIQCESNLLGIVNGNQGTNVGSGGWTNIVDKYAKAKAYCEHPFELRQQYKSKMVVPIRGEWIGDQRNGGYSSERRKVTLCCQSAMSAELAPASLGRGIHRSPVFWKRPVCRINGFLLCVVAPIGRAHDERLPAGFHQEHGRIDRECNHGQGTESFYRGSVGGFYTHEPRVKTRRAPCFYLSSQHPRGILSDSCFNS